MKQFIIHIIRFTAIGSIPFFILVVGYFSYDPFKVIYNYDDYSYAHVIPNRDFISTETFIKRQNKEQYNSFIFGSSRTLAFRPSAWKKFLGKEAKPFVFDASGESIYGIYKKIKYLDSTHVKLKNALIIICRDYTFDQDKNFDTHLFIKHPALSGESKLFFHYTFFKAYLSPSFLYSFYDYTFTQKYKPYMERFLENRKITFDTISNEINILDQEEEIKNNPDAYYEKRKAIFYHRVKEYTNDRVFVTGKKFAMLQEIIQIFKKHGTNYKVVISPLYEQFNYMQPDLDRLYALFGENLYNFSGKNHFTEPYTNYYESSHYRPQLGERILEIIYK